MQIQTITTKTINIKYGNEIRDTSEFSTNENRIQ